MRPMRIVPQFCRYAGFGQRWFARGRPAYTKTEATASRMPQEHGIRRPCRTLPHMKAVSMQHLFAPCSHAIGMKYAKDK